MANKSNLVSETVMYSVNPGTGTVVVHHLPWPKTSPQLQRYTKKGLTFERPRGYDLEPTPRQVEVMVKEVTPGGEVKVETKAVVAGEKASSLACPICGRVCKSEQGLKVHKARSHKKEG